MTEGSAYERKKRAASARRLAQTRSAQDIGPVPDVADWARRDAATASLRAFCETYFPGVFSRPWSPDHLRVLGKLEASIINGEWFACAMPRGSGKTAMERAAALWAIITGRQLFVCMIGGSQRRAKQLLRGIKAGIVSPASEDLRADFPESLYPLACLRNNAKKQLGQHIDGVQTACTWAVDELVFPTVTGERLPQSLRDRGLSSSPASGSIISVTSLDSNMRGQDYALPDGTVVRPSLVLLDDPQTRESARSAEQTDYRYNLLRGDVLGLAGPGEKLAVFIACTKIYEGDLADLILDASKCPEWQGECTKMVYAWPKAEKLWAEYLNVRDDRLRAGEKKALETDFYREHRAEMDAGASVAWPERHNKDELSAIQHAYNLRSAMGEAAFRAEYQNEPAPKTDDTTEILTPAAMCERVNGRPRGQVPLESRRLTAFIDVHKQLLYYCVCAWSEDWSGYVVDYGTFPDQARASFELRSAQRTLGRTYRGAGEDGAIQAGLTDLVTDLLGREWERAGGGVTRIDRLFVDVGYKAQLVNAVKHKAGGAAMIPSKGVGIRAANKPIVMYQRRPGWHIGDGWFVPSVAGTKEFPHICVDVNQWKSIVHSRLTITPGDPGALTLWGKRPGEHRLFAEHVCGSEVYVVTSGHGRDVKEWRWRHERPDNHWLDCLVGCAAAASYAGITTEDGADRKPRKARRVRNLNI